MSALSSTIAVEYYQSEDHLDPAHAAPTCTLGLRDEGYEFGMIERSMDDDNAVRVCREMRGPSAEALAAKAGLVPEVLADIEARRTEPGIRLTVRLAELLHLDIGSLAPWLHRCSEASEAS